VRHENQDYFIILGQHNFYFVEVDLKEQKNDF
jgi:hypothetical protein